MPALFSTHGLRYGDIITYRDIVLHQGEINFITGPSGCGKSTLLRLLNATLSPSAGSLCYRGQELTQWESVALRREVALVSQQVFLFEGSIAENFARFYNYRGLPAPNNQHMQQLLECCALPLPPDKACATMSGGERQRLYTAIFLSLQPRVLLLDEPTSALDSQNAAALLAGVATHCRNQGIDLVVVSHDPVLTQRFAERIIHLEQEVLP